MRIYEDSCIVLPEGVFWGHQRPAFCKKAKSEMFFAMGCAII
jgi:hypothetical protein